MGAHQPIRDGSSAKHLRSHNRASLYLAALLRWEGNESVVRIRNLSAAGAMIESGHLPPSGTPVELMRGSLRARGTTAWAHEGRGGLHLVGSIAIDQWMSPGLNRNQPQIDGLVAALRSGDDPVDWPKPNERAEDSALPDVRLAKRLIDRLSDVLAGDAAVVACHGQLLLDLDLAAQLLGLLCAPNDDVGKDRLLEETRRAAMTALID